MAEPRHGTHSDDTPVDGDGVAAGGATAAVDIVEELIEGGDRPDPDPGPPATSRG